MDFLDQLGKKISNAGKDVAQQANIFAETARLNNVIADRERQITQLCTAIGKAYYELHRDDAADPEAQRLAQINALYEEIADIQENIRQLKGISSCPNCGAELARNTAFCTRCGTPIAPPAPPAPPAEAAPKTCPVCGREGTPEDKFCVRCGTKL